MKGITVRILSAALLAAFCTTVRGQGQQYSLGEDRQWKASATPEEGSDEWVIAEARRLLAEDHPSRARSLLSDWIEQHETTRNPWLPEALLLRGDAKVALNREYRALYDYERVLKQFWGSDVFPIAVQRELEIGLKYAYGRKIRVWGMRIGSGGDVAVEILIRVQERLPGSELAEQAAIELADYFYRKRKMRLAHDAYDLYLENFPEGSHRLRAAQRLIQTDIARFKGPKYDSAGLIDAQIRIEDFLARFPTEADRSGINEALIVRIDESRGAQLLDTGKWYLKTGDWPSARLTLRRLVRDHPKTLAAQRAQEILAKRGWGLTDEQAVTPDDELQNAPATNGHNDDAAGNGS